jgi:hypothetical protein
MEQHEVQQALSNFLSLLETGRGSEAENIRALELVLDRLAFAAHFVDDTFDGDAPDPPSQDYKRFRALASQRFPSFGYYNIPVTVTEHLRETDLMLGDAIDDLADIACDLGSIRWCWIHTSEEDALWHFHFGFEHHFGPHLRNLQWYIHAFKQER